MITHLSVGSKIQFQGVELTIVQDHSCGGYRLADHNGKFKTTQPIYCDDLISIEMLNKMITYIIL